MISYVGSWFDKGYPDKDSYELSVGQGQASVSRCTRYLRRVLYRRFSMMGRTGVVSPVLTRDLT